MIDKTTSLPVAFATIKVLNKAEGVITSEKGEFRLPLDPSDSISVSCVGYSTVILVVRNIDTTISLEPKLKTLPNVDIRVYKNFETVWVGDKIKKHRQVRYWMRSGSTLKEEFAQRMDLPDSGSTYKLKTITIPSERGNCQGPLLLHIYLPDTVNQVPGEEIFLKMLTTATEKMKYVKGKLLIDVAEENIYLSSLKHFYIGLSWHDEIFATNCFTNIMISRDSKEVSYYRVLNSKDYHWYPFGDFRDVNGNSYHETTAYSAVLDKLK